MSELEHKLEAASKMASFGKVSRREFVQLAIAAGTSIVAANAMFTKALRAEPKRGGRLVMGIGHGGTTDSLDPGVWANAFVSDMSTGIWGAQLCRIDQSNAVKPHIAESFEPADKAKRWIFKLRRGLTFHDGKTVTAQDVVQSYNYHRTPESKSAVKSYLEIIEEIAADGPETVIFKLKSGAADFPYVTSDSHLPIYKAKSEGGIEWENGISCGPFILQKFEPGVRLSAKRNPNYYASDRPYFDEVELLSIIDITARTNALVTGDVHCIDRVDLATIGLLKRNANIEITDVPGFGHYVAPMNVTVPPFDNPDVRLALKWAIDREEIVNKILYGYGKVGNDSPIAAGVRYASSPRPAYRYDPDKVGFHLKKAGLSSLQVDLSVSNAAFAGAVNSALLMQQSAKAAGIDINVIRESEDSYWANVWMKKPWCMSYWGGRPTCDWMFTTAYAEGAAWNDSFWANRRFNELLVAARSETDEKVRAGQYAEMQQLVHDDGGVAVLMFNNFVGAHLGTLAHGELNSNYDHDGGYIYERWWFA
jgi:peptide/nickel transport system substrate-binding protein